MLTLIIIPIIISMITTFVILHLYKTIEFKIKILQDVYIAYIKCKSPIMCQQIFSKDFEDNVKEYFLKEEFAILIIGESFLNLLKLRGNYTKQPCEPNVCWFKELFKSTEFLIEPTKYGTSVDFQEKKFNFQNYHYYFNDNFEKDLRLYIQKFYIKQFKFLDILFKR